jgi:dTDP-4-dehydrorhamnose reductase
LAARVLDEGPVGPRVLLGEVWDRYQLPLAITEAHNGCTREEQIRWLMELWTAASAARSGGADVRAVTAWSLLGAFDWDTLLTQPARSYEPGVFDLRGTRPRPTAAFDLLRTLAAGGVPDHPVLDVPGWWRRPERLIYGVSVETPASAPDVRGAARGVPVTGLRSQVKERTRELLITGATGTLGRAFGRACVSRGLPYRLLSRQDMDIACANSVRATLDDLRPWAVINAAGYVRVDDAEADPERCMRENLHGPTVLAEACRDRNLQLVSFSSDLVFDGQRGEPYVETDPAHPLNAYGDSKLAAEKAVLAVCQSALMVRTSAFFSPWDHYNFVTLTLQGLQRRQHCMAASDAIISPTYVPDLVECTLDLLIDGERGLWHLATPAAVTWAELARLAAERVGIDATTLVECPTREMDWVASRPRYSALSSERGILLPSLERALDRYAEAWTTQRAD